MKLCSEVHTLRARWTDYKLEMRTNVPIFKVKEASVRRRYSDFKVKILFQFLMMTKIHEILPSVAPRRAGPHRADHDAPASRQGLRQAAALYRVRRRDL